MTNYNTYREGDEIVKVPVIKSGVQKLNVQTSNDIITIEKLVKNVSSGLWDTDPEYQRQYKWKPREKRELITSLLKGVPLPLFYLRAKGNKYEVLDGKQRSLTIHGFITNKISYNIGNGKTIYWRNLPETEKREILSSTVTVRFLMNTSDADAVDIFVALQNGERIKTEEIRHALGGSAIENIKQIIDDTDFKKCNAFCRGGNYTKNETIITKFMYLEHILSGNVTSDIMDDNSLYNMVKTYVDQDMQPAMVDTIKKRVETLVDIYKDVKNPLTPQLPMTYASYLLVAQLQDSGTLSDAQIANKMRDFADYVRDLRTDYLVVNQDPAREKHYTEKEYQWYRTSVDNFGKRGTAKSGVHIFTDWFPTIYKHFEEKFMPKTEEPKKRKVLTLFN